MQLYGVEMPQAYISPWSRVVDLPYILLVSGMRFFIAEEQAMGLAFLIWPIVMLCVFCILWFRTLQNLDFDRSTDRHIPVIASFLLLMPTLLEFSPGRIDHHNIQLIMLVAALLGVSRRSQAGMILSGTACVLSIVVGLELAPVVFVIAVSPCLAWVSGFENSRERLLTFAATVAAIAPLAGLAFVGPTRLWATECDAFSAPYLKLLVGYGGIVLAATGLIRTSSRLVRFASLAIPSLALLVWVGKSHPLCLGGPYPMVDPVIWEIWISQIPQERSFLQYFERRDWPSIGLLSVYLIILAASLQLVISRLRSGDAALATIYAVAAMLLALYLLQTRFSRFPPVALAMFLAMIWERIRIGGKTEAATIGLASFICVSGSAALAHSIPKIAPAPALIHFLAHDDCAQEVNVLAALPPGRILLPPALGLALLDQLPDGMSVGALSFHRGSPGMRRFYDVFLSDNAQERRTAAEQFQYLAVCDVQAAIDFPAGSLMETIQAGEAWAGLQTVLANPVTGFMLFRINHAELR
ncbi:hypothetical protein [Rhizobium sp. FKY42]|uniref:hypothetical protein n=1 Tax=Rhizobium sp. FKY42 TaxID=2562310 RepID=UPI0010BF70F8|nr:hypothetical protein [Rhizobium sp. FKY42]